MGIIYKLTSPSGKSYIGLTKQTIEKRLWKHKRSQRCRLLQKAIKKYGFDSFKVEVLDANVPHEKLGDLEKKRIAEHKTLAPNGYNLSTGGQSGFKYCQSTRLRQAEATSITWKDEDVRKKRIAGMKQFQADLDEDGIQKRLLKVSDMHTSEIKERANAGKRRAFTRLRIETFLTLYATDTKKAQKYLKSAIARDKKRGVRGWWGEGHIP
jgi:group I intron endonuclease